MQGSVEWPQLMTIVGMLVSSGIIIAGGVVWLWSKMSLADKENRKAIEELRTSQNDLRVEVAQKYVPHTELAKVEIRIETTLAQIAAQFERGFDRLTDMISKIATRSE